MNGYGRRAQRHWQEFRPQQAAGLDDPEAFFAQLGTDAAREVSTLWSAERLAEPLVEGESFLERAGRFQRMRQEAESAVLGELVLLPAEADPDLLDDPHLDSAELAEEQWREHHLHGLLAGRCAPGDFTAGERERLRADAPARLLELTGLSDAALRRQGLL
ncbi:hypothetical protein ABZW18_00240 [Streptomyces sp. NPDC004647]|uniref:hypothetical protein n=1 Tax=Streptomyces sp. NPDC004647 TaxID=3154671 RepID=UPI0033B90917